MAGDYRLEGLAVPETLHELHGLLEQAGNDHPEVPSDDLMLFETAVIEIAGNLVEHGRPKGQVTYTFVLRILVDRLEGVIDDGGQAIELPERKSMPDGWSEHGRGLALADAALDQLTYRRDGDRNVWVMTRYRH